MQTYLFELSQLSKPLGTPPNCVSAFPLGNYLLQEF